MPQNDSVGISSADVDVTDKVASAALDAGPLMGLPPTVASTGLVTFS